MSYPLLPIHPKYRSPSGEAGQILVGGRALKVTAFHGESDDEADWHVYLGLTREVQRDLADGLRKASIAVPDDRSR